MLAGKKKNSLEYSCKRNGYFVSLAEKAFLILHLSAKQITESCPIEKLLKHYANASRFAKSNPETHEFRYIMFALLDCSR